MFNYCCISLSPSLPPIFCHSFIFSFDSSFVCYSIRCLTFLSLLLCQIFIYFLLQCPLFRLLNVVYSLFLTFLILFCGSVFLHFTLFISLIIFFLCFLFLSLFSLSPYTTSFLPSFFPPSILSLFLFCVFFTLYFLSVFSFLLFPCRRLFILCCFCNICLFSTFTSIPSSLFLSLVAITPIHTQLLIFWIVQILDMQPTLDSFSINNV